MKIKITVFFLIVSTLVVILVFKKDFILNNSIKSIEVADEQLLSKENIIRFFDDNKIQDYIGHDVNLSKKYLDQIDIITIHFWASWCAPCVNEVPELVDFVKRENKIYGQLKLDSNFKILETELHSEKKEKLKILFIAVSLDENSEELHKFLKSFSDFDSDLFVRVWDKNSKLSKLFNADRLPMTVILNKKINEPRIVRGVVDWKNINF